LCLSKSVVEYAAPGILVMIRYFFRFERTVGTGARCVGAPTADVRRLKYWRSPLRQNYSRYCSGEFERRWRTRLKAPPQLATSHLHVVVTHRFPAPNRYGWEIRPPTGLSVEESHVQFASWEEASQAGNLALKQLSTER